jgi:hypothetical protein
MLAQLDNKEYKVNEEFKAYKVLLEERVLKDPRVIPDHLAIQGQPVLSDLKVILEVLRV